MASPSREAGRLRSLRREGGSRRRPSLSEAQLSGDLLVLQRGGKGQRLVDPKLRTVPHSEGLEAEPATFSRRGFHKALANRLIERDLEGKTPVPHQLPKQGLD